MDFAGSRCSLEITEKAVTKSCSITSNSTVSTSVGEEFELSYRLSTDQIASGSMNIHYDTELFEVVSVTNGGFLTDKIADINTALDGTIAISFVGTTYQYKYDGTDVSVQDFVENVARARTFGKYSEWEYLKKRGMGRGANESNVIALNDVGDGTLNQTIWPDEFVRHKIVDAVGDMFTSGGFVCGKLESYKGSHALNNLVLKKLFSDAANYDIIDA